MGCICPGGKIGFQCLAEKIEKALFSPSLVWRGRCRGDITECGWNAIMEFGRDRGKTGTGGKKGNHSTGKITGHISVVFGRGSGDG